jgi:serine/threonine protein kinase
MTTPADDPTNNNVDPYLGMTIALPGFGRIQLSELVRKTSDTAIYRTVAPKVAVKVFNIEGDTVEEISHAGSLGYGVEVENFQDITVIPELTAVVPGFYGAQMIPEEKFAFVAMEYLQGEDLQTWCEQGATRGYQDDWIVAFRKALYETLEIMQRFHEQEIILIDFKADNVIRRFDGAIKFVDMGAFFTPRHRDEGVNYIYSATPDYAELVIDSCNVETKQPLTEASDIFSAGVAMFEMAVGRSRLEVASETAAEILSNSSIYLFRESQIKDVWKAYPHLEGHFPLVETQLKERRLLFSEFWHVLRGLAEHQRPDWETLTDDEHHEIIFDAGVAFIKAQLPENLQWLALPIAHATTLRKIRIQSVAELMELLRNPIDAPVSEDLKTDNCLLQYLANFEQAAGFAENLNSWQVRYNRHAEHWMVSAIAACKKLGDQADYMFLKTSAETEYGHRSYCISDELDSDDFQGRKLTLRQLWDDHLAWLDFTPQSVD